MSGGSETWRQWSQTTSINPPPPCTPSAMRSPTRSSRKASPSTVNVAMGLLEKLLPTLMRLRAVYRRSRDSFSAVDIAGYSYAVGRYRRDGALHPDRVIVGSETSATALAEHWNLVEELICVIGDVVRTGWDYIGEAGVATKQYNDFRRLLLPLPRIARRHLDCRHHRPPADTVLSESGDLTPCHEHLSGAPGGI